MQYPKIRFFILQLLGQQKFIEKAKKRIDLINALEEKEQKELSQIQDFIFSNMHPEYIGGSSFIDIVRPLTNNSNIFNPVIYKNKNITYKGKPINLDNCGNIICKHENGIFGETICRECGMNLLTGECNTQDKK